MLTIRPENDADRVAVFEVNRLAFGQDNEARLVEVLRAAPDHIPELSLVAEMDGRVVGHILFSPIHIRAFIRLVPALALAPMAVHPDFQRQGIGSTLVCHGLEACKTLGHKIVIVLGHPAFYPRFGFVPAIPKDILPPFDVPVDAFMVCELVPEACKHLHGTVRYPHAFDSV
jgi:putative acetyltransferase